MAFISCDTYYTCKNMVEVQKHVEMQIKSEGLKPEEVVVLWDCDEALLATGCGKEEGGLGSMTWRNQVRSTLTSLEKSGKIASANDLFGNITLFIAHSLKATAVQRETAQVTQDFFHLGIQNMLFTARGSSGEDAWYKLNVTGVDALTQQQLEQAGIATHVFKNMIFIQNKPKDSVISTEFNKGTFANVKLIVLIDDKKDAVETVGKAVSSQNIAYLGIHYTAIVDVEKEHYSAKLANMQLTNLLFTNTLLPKEEQAQCWEGLSEKFKTPSAFQEQFLTWLDGVFKNHGIYEKKGASTEEVFKAIQQAMASQDLKDFIENA